MAPIKCHVTECSDVAAGRHCCLIAPRSIQKWGIPVGSLVAIKSQGWHVILKADCLFRPRDCPIAPETVGLSTPLFAALGAAECQEVTLDLVNLPSEDLTTASTVLLRWNGGKEPQQDRVLCTALCSSSAESVVGMAHCGLSPAGKVLCSGIAVMEGTVVPVRCWGKTLLLHVVSTAPAGRLCCIGPSTTVQLQVPQHLAPTPPSHLAKSTPNGAASINISKRPSSSSLGTGTPTTTVIQYITAAWAQWRKVLQPSLASCLHKAILLELSSLACALFAHAKFRSSTVWRQVGLDYTAMDRSLPFSCVTGVLIHGISGVGKTALGRLLCDLLSKLPVGNPSDIGYIPPVATYFWDVTMDFFTAGRVTAASAGRALRAAFREATMHTPAILVLDNVDALHAGSFADTSSRVGLLELLHQLDLLALRRTPALVICIASQLSRVDRTLIGVGRLEKVIEVPIPTCEGRMLLMDQLVPRNWVQDSKERQHLFAMLADQTNGYLPAGLRQLVCHAILRSSSGGESGPMNIHVTVQGVQVSIECESSDETPLPPQECFEWALQHMANAGTAAAAAFGHIGVSSAASMEGPLIGLESHLERVMKHVLLPLERPRELASLGIRVPRGLLLFGPSGTGKTYLANHIQHHRLAVNLNVLSANAAELVHKVVGESEKAVARLFAAARAAAPCLLFIDQFEAVASKRSAGTHQAAALDRLLSTLLIELDGIAGHGAGAVVLVAATNQRHLLDPAVLRSGRLDIQLEFCKPNSSEREVLLRGMLAQVRCDTDLPLQQLVSCTEGYTPADLRNVVQRAALQVIRRAISHVKDKALNPDVVHVTLSDIMAAVQSYR